MPPEPPGARLLAEVLYFAEVAQRIAFRLSTLRDSYRLR